MDAQIIFQAGNSLAVTIPKKTVSDLGWKRGKKVYIRHDPIEKTVTIAENAAAETGLTPEYFAWKEKVLNKNAKLLIKLSQFHGK